MKLRRRFHITVTIILLILAVYFIFPFYWLTIGITKNVGQLFQKSLLPGIPSHLRENVSRVFAYQDGVFFHWMGNSLLYAGVGPLWSFIASLAGYAFEGMTLSADAYCLS